MHSLSHPHTLVLVIVLVLVLELAPLPDTGRVVYFYQEAKPDKTFKLETPSDLERPI